ncbi:MAG: nucleotide pyrophosphohydrolase [Promethearchaeota archaeon]
MDEYAYDMTELIGIIRKFVQERDWEQYNKPAALAVSASIEMGELLELFQWKTDEDVEQAIQNDAFVALLTEEIADVLVYLLRMCDKAGIDPSKAVLEKMRKNAEKYPIDEWKGKAPSKLNRSE